MSAQVLGCFTPKLLLQALHGNLPLALRFTGIELNSPPRLQVKQLHKLDLSRLQFVGEALSTLRKEMKGQAAVVGFIGSPWTLATYLIEGGSSQYYKTIKSMAHSSPQLLDAMLSHLADQIADYVRYQIDSGAQCMQIFDSWGGQLPPREWDRCVAEHSCRNPSRRSAPC